MKLKSETKRVPIDELIPYPGNPRRGDVDLIKQSLQAFGQYKTIAVQRSTGYVIAGNHTLQAARELGWSELDVTFVDCDEMTARRIVAVDNRSSDRAEYDDAELVSLLQGITDLDATGYDAHDLSRLLETLKDEEPAGDDINEVPPVPEDPITRKGDVWRLADARVMCGDSRESKDVARLLAGAEVNVAITSPPYADRRKYDQSSGFEPIHPDRYVEWFEAVARNVERTLAADGSWFVNIKAGSNGLKTELYVLDLVLAHVRRWGWTLATDFCWERAGLPGKPHRRFKNQFEPIYQFARGEWKFRPGNVQRPSDKAIVDDNYSPGLETWQGSGTGDKFKGRSGAGMAYPGNRLPTFAGSHEATGHAAAFPVGLPEFFIRAYSDEGDCVFDPFLGSGSTVLAAQRQNRVGFGMELSPAYVDVTCKRFERHIGVVPILERDGKAKEVSFQ